jgi:hypothetical protein
MSDFNKLRLSLCSTYLLFQQAAEECPVGPIAAACENLADALRSYGYLPSEASRVVAEAGQ